MTKDELIILMDDYINDSGIGWALVKYIVKKGYTEDEYMELYDSIIKENDSSIKEKL